MSATAGTLHIEHYRHDSSAEPLAAEVIRSLEARRARQSSSVRVRAVLEGALPLEDLLQPPSRSRCHRQSRIAAVTAELNRGPEHRNDKHPQLGDLRDSDIIAQIADTVILLHRPDAYERDDPRMDEADLILTKHRTGPTSIVTVAHQLHYNRFVDMAQE